MVVASDVALTAPEAVPVLKVVRNQVEEAVVMEAEVVMFGCLQVAVPAGVASRGGRRQKELGGEQRRRLPLDRQDLAVRFVRARREVGVPELRGSTRE